MISRFSIAVMIAVGCLAAAPDVPILPPNAPPRIVRLALSSNVVNSGGVLSGEVIASSNVASVEIRVVMFSYNMVKIAPGEFTLTTRIPRVPRVFRKTYDLVAIARNTRGDAVRRTTSLTIR